MTDDYEKFSKLFKLDYETGHLYWRQYRKGVRYNRPAGVITKNGYRRIMVDGRYYWAHRIVLLLVNKKWPDITDHINQIKSDNRPINLRDTNKSVNALNKRSPSVATYLVETFYGTA